MSWWNAQTAEYYTNEIRNLIDASGDLETLLSQATIESDYTPPVELQDRYTQAVLIGMYTDVHVGLCEISNDYALRLFSRETRTWTKLVQMYSRGPIAL